MPHQPKWFNLVPDMAKPGMVVRLAGSPCTTMTIIEKGGAPETTCLCAWIDKHGQPHQERYPARALERREFT